MINFKDVVTDLKGRIKNPLIGSFIIVWFFIHWKFVYIVVMSSAPDIEQRLSKFDSYISAHNGWKGMIFIPLVFSLISLITYYLTAILAQAIRVFVGKRLSAFFLAKFDKGSFALKSELELETKQVTKLGFELQKTKTASVQLQEEMDIIRAENLAKQHELDQKNQEIRLLRSDLLSNSKYREVFDPILLYHLARSKTLAVEGIKPEVYKSHFRVIQGTWKIVTSNIFSRLGETKHLAIEDNEVCDLSGNIYGSIENLVFDKKLKLLEFTLHGSNSYNYILIQTSINEFIGFQDNLFCILERDQ